MIGTRHDLILACKFLSPCSEIRVWTLEGDSVYSMSGHTSFVYSLSLLPNGDIVSAGEDRSVRIWEGELVRKSYLCSSDFSQVMNVHKSSSIPLSRYGLCLSCPMAILSVVAAMVSFGFLAPRRNDGLRNRTSKSMKPKSRPRYCPLNKSVM